MGLFLVGLNHTTAPVALRERLYFGSASQKEGLQVLHQQLNLAEALILCTCNRTEIFACGNDPLALMQYLAARAEMTLDELYPHLYVHEAGAAVTHLFRVVCGLDSLVLGETQILKQVRDALETAREADCAKRELIGLFQQAVATGKRARTETSISQGAFSIGRAGVELVRSLFPDLSGSPVLILGAGKMSELTAKHLTANGVKTVFVANRTYTHAQELAERLGGQAIHYEALESALTSIDIVISSTSAPHVILSASQITHIQQQRHGRPLCFIDIAVPRDIDPTASLVPNVHLYNIDDLRNVADRNREQREAEIPKVEEIIANEVTRWQCWQAGQDSSSTISALRDSFEQIRRNELERFTNVLAALTPEQQRAVEKMTSSLVNKLLHAPTVRMKEILAQEPERRPDTLVQELFALESQELPQKENDV